MTLRVKEICKERGITISALASDMGIKQETLSRAINGNPTIKTLDRIASTLGVPITELFEKQANSAIKCPNCGKMLNLKVV